MEKTVQAAGITIAGSGSYCPGSPVSNDALARVMDTSDEWIRRRTGISQRHYAPHGVGASDLGYEAAKRAIANAGIEASSIDYIIFATMTPDFAFPGPGGMLSSLLGIAGTPALDIRQQCAAIPFALQVADSLVRAGAASTVLLVGAETHAPFMPWEDWGSVEDGEQRPVSKEAWERASRHRGLAVLFGDGAGALVLKPADEAERGFIGAQVHSDGALAKQIFLEAGGFRKRPYMDPSAALNEENIPRMEGRELFKHAVTKLPRVVRELCAQHDVTLQDVDWFLAHQANDRINQAVREALRVPEERVPSNIALYGNTSGATIPILVDELRSEGKLKQGELVCFLALGSGLHWGAALMRL